MSWEKKKKWRSKGCFYPQLKTVCHWLWMAALSWKGKPLMRYWKTLLGIN